jgi:hemoglobin-like flavoprotein
VNQDNGVHFSGLNARRGGRRVVLARRYFDAQRESHMTPQDRQLVQESFAKVVPIAEQAAALFYRNLFDRDPALKDLFRGDMVAQGRKLMQMIGTAVNGLDRLDGLVPVVRDLGRRHVHYGVLPQHYDTVGAALIDTLAAGLGPAFTPEVRQAWLTVYGVLATTMKNAAHVGEPAVAVAG